jgi:hypothetical protein
MGPLSLSGAKSAWVGSCWDNRRNGGAGDIIGNEVGLRRERRCWNGVEYAFVYAIDKSEEE